MSHPLSQHVKGDALDHRIDSEPMPQAFRASVRSVSNARLDHHPFDDLPDPHTGQRPDRHMCLLAALLRLSEAVRSVQGVEIGDCCVVDVEMRSARCDFCQAAPAAMVVSAPGDLGPELLNAAIQRRPIDIDPTLGEQIPDVSVRQWEPTIPADGKKDDVPWMPVALERIAAHASLPVVNAANAIIILPSLAMQQSRVKTDPSAAYLKVKPVAI
jgi:hypothetical protein